MGQVRRRFFSFSLRNVLLAGLIFSSVIAINEDDLQDQNKIENGKDVNKFYDISSLDMSEKRRLVESIVLVMETGDDIDWVKAKENYDLSVDMTSLQKSSDTNMEESDQEVVDENRRRLGLLNDVNDRINQKETSLVMTSASQAPQGRAGHLGNHVGMEVGHNDDNDHDDHVSTHMQEIHKARRHRYRRGYRKKAKSKKYKKYYKKRYKKHYHYDDYYNDDYYYDDYYYDDYYRNDNHHGNNDRSSNHGNVHTHFHEHEGGLIHKHSHGHNSAPNHHSISVDTDDAVETDDPGDTGGGGYNYGRGGCPNPGSRGVPCAPDNLGGICNKYDDIGSFRNCLDACKPSFCCIHDANNNDRAVPCADDENCAQYSYCYIVWWKLHDTIGPAIYLQIEQADDFFDVDAGEIEQDVTGIAFFEELLFHHFDNFENIIRDNLDPDGNFNARNVFNEPSYWE